MLEKQNFVSGSKLASRRRYIFASIQLYKRILKRFKYWKWSI